eukprot:GFYU01015477.1.p1 GENE.GFYU01015477.1~~GFYU01015477.1.p1  ORF type:complete len:209 (+),score=41.69 GFYU01015477.1:95-628(+)
MPDKKPGVAPKPCTAKINIFKNYNAPVKSTPVWSSPTAPPIACQASTAYLDSTAGVGSWCPLPEAGAWFQIDAGKVTHILSVTIQGRSTTPDSLAPAVSWITKFKLAVSDDESTWKELPNELDGTTCQECKVVRELPKDTKGRFVRIFPTKFQLYAQGRFDISTSDDPNIRTCPQSA